MSDRPTGQHKINESSDTQGKTERKNDREIRVPLTNTYCGTPHRSRTSCCTMMACFNDEGCPRRSTERVRFKSQIKTVYAGNSDCLLGGRGESGGRCAEGKEEERLLHHCRSFVCSMVSCCMQGIGVGVDVSVRVCACVRVCVCTVVFVAFSRCRVAMLSCCCVVVCVRETTSDQTSNRNESVTTKTSQQPHNLLAVRTNPKHEHIGDVSRMETLLSRHSVVIGHDSIHD